MPKKPIDYSKALIYSIVCKTDETLLYIGSTTNFKIRKNSHKKCCNVSEKTEHNTALYKMIRANGGWDAFEIKPIKEFPCETSIQLVIEEERVRQEMNANLNTLRAYRSREDRLNDKKEYARIHRDLHKKEISERRKELYLAKKNISI